MEMLLKEALGMIRSPQVMLRDVTDPENPIIQDLSIMNAKKLDDIMINNRGIYQITTSTTLLTYERKGECK